MFTTAHWLNEQGYHSKAWVPRCGKPRGGRPFQKSGIQRILTNPVYIGKVAHHAKNKIYQGKHEAIVPKDIWEQAQEFIRRRVKDKNAFSHYQVHDSVLSRKLYDDTGRSFRLTTAKKQGKKFLYYYNGIDKYYLSKGWRGRFMLKTVKMVDFDNLNVRQQR